MASPLSDRRVPEPPGPVDRPLDTTAEAWQIQHDIWRRMSVEEKVRMVCELSDTTRALAVAGARQRRPDATEAEIQAEVIRLMLGDELWRQAYGDRSGT